jgi:membrane protein
MVTVAVAYETEETRPRLKLRAMAYGFTAAALVGVSLMVFVIGVVPNLLRRVDLGGAAERTIAIFQYPVLALLFAVALTVLYRYAPDREPRTPWRNPGAVAGTLLFLAFAIGFSIYSANVGAMPASYGLLGSIAALMIFLQLTAISVIVGAEVNSMVESFPARDEALARSRDGIPRDRVPRDRVPRDGMPRDRVSGDRVSGEAIGFGKAMAGLAALFLLGRSNRD